MAMHRSVQFVLELVVAILAAGVVSALLIPLLSYLDRMPAYPWNGVLVFGVMVAVIALVTLRHGGSLRRP
jgi:predicted PurR-regulated permease PerM